MEVEREGESFTSNIQRFSSYYTNGYEKRKECAERGDWKGF